MIGNVVTKKYMSNNEKFADVFNYILYDGHSVINPEDLWDCDVSELLATENRKGELIVKDKMRDIKKGWILKRDSRAAYLMLGIENQSNVHYAMPVRNMLYDALEYESQLKSYGKKNKNHGNLQGAEFISGFSKEDKLIPVITVVVYFGADIWDGPKTLYDMFDIKDKRILEFISDYKMNLIEPAEIKDTEKFRSDFRYVLDFIKNSKDKERLKEMMKANRDFFSKVPQETALLIKHCANVDIRVKKEEEETNMCKAIEDMMEDAKEEGRIEGKIEMIIKLNKKGLLSEENSAEELNMSLDKYREKVRMYSEKLA